MPAVWRDVSPAHRWELFVRIAMGATREVHRRFQVFDTELPGFELQTA